MVRIAGKLRAQLASLPRGYLALMGEFPLRPILLRLATAASILLAVLLISARVAAWARDVELDVAHAGSSLRMAAGPEGIYLGWRRGWFLPAGVPSTPSPAQWWWSSRVNLTPSNGLEAICIVRGHDWWIAPGVWLGYGRDHFVDYFDL